MGHYKPRRKLQDNGVSRKKEESLCQISEVAKYRVFHKIQDETSVRMKKDKIWKMEDSGRVSE